MPGGGLYTAGNAMSLKKTWMLSAGLLLVVGTLGCGDKPAPVAVPGPVVDPEEPRGEPEPVAEEARQGPGPELGREAAIAEIERLEGTYRCDEASCDRAIVGVNLIGTQVADAGLEHLKGLTSLQVLNLGGSPVTDAGLEHMKGLTSLQSLYLSSTQVTDASVKKLKEALPNCKISR